MRLSTSKAGSPSEVDIAFGEQEGTAFVSGDGTNKPKGFLSYTKVADASWSWGNIGYIATGAAGAFKASGPSDTLIDAIYALKAGHRQNASFVMNRKTQAEIRKFKDADGNYLWQPPAAAGQAGLADGLSDHRGRGHARYRRQRLRDRVWRFRAPAT